MCNVWFLSSHRTMRACACMGGIFVLSTAYKCTVFQTSAFRPYHFRLQHLHCNIYWRVVVKHGKKEAKKINTCGCKCVCSLFPPLLDGLWATLHRLIPFGNTFFAPISYSLGQQQKKKRCNAKHIQTRANNIMGNLTK